MADGTTSATDAPAAAAAARARESHLQLVGEEHARYYSAAALSLSAPSATTDDKVDDNDGNGAMDDNINNDCDCATGNDNNEDAMNDDVDDDGDGATDDYVDNDNGNRTTGDDRTTDDDVDDNGYGAADDDINNDCDGATDGHHCLDACGGCATKSDVSRRHATTGNTTTSQQTRSKWEARHQGTRGDRALIGRGCALRGGGRVERMRGGGIGLSTRNGSP